MAQVHARRSPAWLALALLLAASGAAQAAEAPLADVPLGKVVLFSSGVGFFQHNGSVDGNARVELKFNVDDVNDLLKSMVLEDLDGGRISTVSYSSKEPVSRSLKTFAIDLTAEPTLADLLRQIRGQKVRVLAPKPIEGSIIGVERRGKKVGKDELVESDVLNLFTGAGLKSVAMDEILETQLLDPRLNEELQQALTILATAHSNEKKSVVLNFQGAGKRKVRVGYILESPVWKTSYRLVLDEAKAPFLQGWAIVENTSEQDWNSVGLTLVSGRPISFIMDLYQPLYVSRPLVVPELFSSLHPRTYDQHLAPLGAHHVQAGLGGLGGGGFGGSFGGGGGHFGGGGPSRGAPFVTSVIPVVPGREADEKDKLDLSQGVASVAQGDDVGELFRYVIDSPVSLARGQSAMLPIVNASVKGEKLSIYNSTVHAKYPLAGLKLVNTTDLHLMQGPVTVFDEGTYAGEARVDDIGPGAERLVSYALDLDLEVSADTDTAPRGLVAVRIANGVLYATHRQSKTAKYVVKNSGGQPKKLLVEHAIHKDWRLIKPSEPAETTRDLYRFDVAAEPGKSTTLAVELEGRTVTEVAVSGVGEHDTAIYLRAKEVSDGVKQFLAEAAKRHRAVATVDATLVALGEQVKSIDAEQDRIRENMAQLDRNTDLYKRYVKKFTTQEDEIESLREKIKLSIAEQVRLKRTFDEFVLSAQVE